MERQALAFILNGQPVEALAAPWESLAHLLRESLDLTGTKIGCGQGECGACTVLLDGRPVMSCVTPALACQGRRVETIEGLAQGQSLHPLQRSFIEHGAVQCGFCTPGMIMSAKALYDDGEPLSDERLRAELSGNHCRCTGYTKILDAIRAAFAERDALPRGASQ